MTHQHPSGTLSDLLDGQLDPGSHRAWQLHLGECEACRIELEELGRVQQAARGWTPPASGIDGWVALRAKVQAAGVTSIDRAPSRRRPILILVGTAAIAASLVLALRMKPTVPPWPSHVLASATAVAALDTATRPLLNAVAQDARDEFTTMLADADASLREIETLRSETSDSALLADVYLHALESKQRLLEGIRDYTEEGE
jgi:anti-sigma factor RsiW